MSKRMTVIFDDEGLYTALKVAGRDAGESFAEMDAGSPE